MNSADDRFVVVIQGSTRNVLCVFRAFVHLLIVGSVWGVAWAVPAAPGLVEGHVQKVLPQLMDEKGRCTVSPSLFDRDAYQAYLSKNPGKVSGIRYNVRWKARHAEGTKLTLRVELRGMFEGKFPRQATLEQTFDGAASIRRWTELELRGEAYAEFGKITAWRATLWCGDTMLDEYKSFLW